MFLNKCIVYRNIYIFLIRNYINLYKKNTQKKESTMILRMKNKIHTSAIVTWKNQKNVESMELGLNY